MTEMELLNLLPFNQKARAMLEALGEPIDETCLHPVQLAAWAITTGRLEADQALLETLHAMTAWSPERIRIFFMISPDEAPRAPSWAEAQEAEHMAALVLEEIASKMALHFPWYYELC